MSGGRRRVSWCVLETCALWALWVALVVQAITLWHALRPWKTADTPSYLALAEGLGRHEYATLGLPEAVRPPGYPLFLAVSLKLLRLDLPAVVGLQLVMALLAVAAITRLARTAGQPTVLFLLWVAAAPFALAYSAALMAEALALFLIAVALWLLGCPRHRWLALVAGLALGGAALVRADLVLLPLCLAAIVGLARSEGGAAAAARATQLLVGSALVLLPYAAFNWTHFGVAVPVPPGGALGYSLYVATWERHLSTSDLESWYSEPTRALVVSGMQAEVAKLNESLGIPPTTPPFSPESYPPKQRIEAGKRYAGLALERIAAQPLVQGATVFWRSWRVWNTMRWPAWVPGSVRWGLASAASLVWLAGFWGCVLIFFRSDLACLRPVALVVVYLTCLHSLLHTEARYTAAARLPLALCATVPLGCALRSQGAAFREG